MLTNHFLKAYMGKRIWEKLEKQYHAPLYILMPEKQDVYNYYAMLYLKEFMEQKNLEDAVILTCDCGVLKSKELFQVPDKVQILLFPQRKAECLIKYYALYEFSTRLTIISLKKPYDTCGENLLGVKGVTKEDLLCFDIYRFGLNPQKKKPNYTGKQNEIIEFLERDKQEK